MKKGRIASILAAAVMTATAAAMPVKADRAIEQNTAPGKGDTLSCIGSVSKMFATTAVMQLAEEGKVDIDKPVTDYLPDFRMADPRYKDITVRMLMNHTSGLMGTTEGDFMLYDDRDAAPHDTMLAELSRQRLKADPGDFGAYCNDGFEVLELIVEAVSGESFTDYVDGHICKPLGLTQTGTPWNAFRTEEQVETFTAKNIAIAPDYCMDLGSGGIMSTAAELCSFGSSFFSGDNRLLSEKSKKEMGRAAAKDRYEDGFGLGWDQTEYEDYSAAGVKVVSKGGDVMHQHASLVVAPDEEISVSVLSSGGNGTVNQLMAMALMDIALAEKGIKISHPKLEKAETLGKVPEKYLSLAGIYISSEAEYEVSFPDGEYMEITVLTEERRKAQQFMYTTDDRFVQVTGSVKSGKAVQPKNASLLSFRTRNGIDYICADEYMGSGDIGSQYHYYKLQKAEPNPVSDEAQKAWDERSGRRYYLYNGKYSNAIYNGEEAVSFRTAPEAKGYVSGSRIIDKDHLEAALKMPGGRDLRDIEIRYEDGKEFAVAENCALEFISEEAIPEFTGSISEVELSTKKAVWFRTSDSETRTITLDIPENAAVYVYDSADRVVYSSYMKDYGNSVPLPSKGKIVFLGEDGGTVKISG